MKHGKISFETVEQKMIPPVKKKAPLFRYNWGGEQNLR